ncbi:MAG TPA: hypothetical protein VK188_07155 [Holophaga sp.]|nr:hypothetical protein [Holophaga sp.]
MLAALETERKGTDQDEWRAAAASVRAAMRAADFKPVQTVDPSSGLAQSKTSRASDGGSRTSTPLPEAEPDLVPPLGEALRAPKVGWIAAPWTPGGKPLPAGVSRVRIIPPSKEEAAKGHPFAMVCLAASQLFRLSWDGQRTELLDWNREDLPWTAASDRERLPRDFLVEPDGSILCVTGRGDAFRLKGGKAVWLGYIRYSGIEFKLFQGAGGQAYARWGTTLCRLGVDDKGALTQDIIAGGYSTVEKRAQGFHQRQKARTPLTLTASMAFPDGRIILQTWNGGESDLCQLVDTPGGFDLVPIQRLDGLQLAFDVDLLPRDENSALMITPERFPRKLVVLTPEGRYDLNDPPAKRLFARHFQPVPGGFLGIQDQTFMFMEDPGGAPDALNRAFHEGLEAVKAGDEESYQAALMQIVAMELAGVPIATEEQAEVNALLDDHLGSDLRGLVQGYHKDPGLPLRAVAAIRTLETAWDQRAGERKAP